MEWLVAAIVDESKWLTVSMTLAVLAVVLLLRRQADRGPDSRTTALAAMSLFFAVTIATMALGHTLAVTTKLVTGTLDRSTAPLYAIGVALAVPSGWLAHQAWSRPPSDLARERRTLVLNGWLSLTLLVLGLVNLPLAVPGLLNVAYQLRPHRWVGRAILALAVIVNLGLFVGSVVFFASGQSFEEFRGSR
jgi:hypothetical protein